MRRWTPGLLVLAGATLIAGCAATSPKASGRQADEVTARCEQVVPGCRAERLPNVVLSGEARDGALGPVKESLEEIISFDEALAAAWREDGHPEAKTVQVVLGSADRKALHWDSEGDLFYAITWTGVCVIAHGGYSRSPSHSSTCMGSEWGTVIDAHTGAFIVGGNS